MINKTRIAWFLGLVGLTFLSGYLVQKFCYRFPTVEEMSEYHRGHFKTKLDKIEHQYAVRKEDGVQCVLFKGTHKAGGKDEDYYVEAGKRWVLPWRDYNWKRD